MQQRVKDIPIDARHWVEQLLGRQVKDDETIWVRTAPIIKEAPLLEERSALVQELEAYFDEIEKQREGVDPKELEAAYDAAMRHVRPSYNPVR